MLLYIAIGAVACLAIGAGAASSDEECPAPIKTGRREGELISHTNYLKCTHPVGHSCVWHVIASENDPDSRLAFRFIDYEMPQTPKPCVNTSLDFYDDTDPKASTFKSLCEGRVIPTGFNSTSNKVKIVLRTDLYPARGFRLAWKNFRVCRPTDFQCKDEDCINPIYRCDGGSGLDSECADRSDETGCTPLTQCHNSSMIMCDHNLKCYMKDYKCDGVDDCRDKSDEKGCTAQTCKDKEFSCDKYKCMDIRKQCDSKVDCRDGSDENLCTVKTCSGSEFACENKFMCIPKNLHCDGVEDCHDRSDEKNCKPVDCKGTGKNACGNKYQCFEDKQKCNGVNDCRDGKDEEGCIVKTCSSNQKRCAHKYECIPNEQWCDGVADCNDDSDEKECKVQTCDSTTFRCDKYKCMDKRKQCDGKVDCRDNSDEAHCARPTPLCMPKWTHCENSQSILEKLECTSSQPCFESSEMGCP